MMEYEDEIVVKPPFSRWSVAAGSFLVLVVVVVYFVFPASERSGPPPTVTFIPRATIEATAAPLRLHRGLMSQVQASFESKHQTYYTFKVLLAQDDLLIIRWFQVYEHDYYQTGVHGGFTADGITIWPVINGVLGEPMDYGSP